VLIDDIGQTSNDVGVIDGGREERRVGCLEIV
jgi:hypothetical protein